MTPQFQQAQFLRERGRHEEAVALIHSHLAHHPQDPDAFTELALNRLDIPGQMENALADARTATALRPDDPFQLALQSIILSRMDREKEALPLATEAVALDPSYGYAWRAKCIALCGLSRWREAEECARSALSLNPDDDDASNLLAHTLRIQNRLDESEEETKRRLARSPENAFSFATAGWSALQRGQIKEAEGFFKESLRLDPNMDYARNGLKEAYRARSAFYRVFLKWSFLLQGMQEKHQLGIYIGIFISFRLVRIVVEKSQPILLLPLFLVYYIFIFGSWLSTGLANFFLLRDSTARLSLDLEEKIEGLVVGMLFFLGLITACTGFGLGNYAAIIGGGALMAAAIPATLIFTNPSVIGRFVFSAAALGVVFLGGFSAYLQALDPAKKPFDGTGGLLLSLAIVTAVGMTWLAMIPALRKKKMT